MTEATWPSLRAAMAAGAQLTVHTEKGRQTRAVLTVPATGQVQEVHLCGRWERLPDGWRCGRRFGDGTRCDRYYREVPAEAMARRLYQSPGGDIWP